MTRIKLDVLSRSIKFVNNSTDSVDSAWFAFGVPGVGTWEIL